MIIDSDSDEENFTQWEKKAKMYEISGEGKYTPSSEKQLCAEALSHTAVSGF